ncbi:acyltransferase [Leptospira sp. 201903071]|uniref:acyltransferase family protein n=1 Tax=Leptospira ainazelensis TaxID=2810034 RepID=UPI001963EE46|nr:acyltransferase [Leptospira ainazelensis]MBM9499048.1 acyltransferase [Leptospira ainazelensis]
MKAIIKDLWSYRETEIRSLNGLRAFAIILVILNHYALVWEELGTFHSESYFWSGVDLSFVLSGFLISMGLWKGWERNGKINYKNFYLKRTLRIFPPYFLFLTISFAFLTFALKIAQEKEMLQQTNRLSLSLMNSWGDFVFLGNYVQGFNIHTWSLSMEEQFYLVFPYFCGWVLFKRNAKVRQLFLWFLLLIPTLTRVWIYLTTSYPSSPEYFREIYFPFHTRFDSILAGVITMDIYVNHKRIVAKFQKNGLLYYSFLIFFVCLWYAAHWIHEGQSNILIHTIRYNFLNLGFAGILFLSIVRFEGLLHRFLSLTIFVPIARMSFTIYLWHLVLIGVAISILGIQSAPESNAVFFGQFLVVFVFILLLAFPLYVLIEYPFQRLRAKLFSK